MNFFLSSKPFVLKRIWRTLPFSTACCNDSLIYSAVNFVSSNLLRKSGHFITVIFEIRFRMLLETTKTRYATQINMTINMVISMFPFDPTENIRKPSICRCFQGDLKGTMKRKGLRYGKEKSLS